MPYTYIYAIYVFINIFLYIAYYKDGILNHLGTDGLFNKMCWGNYRASWKKIKVDRYLILYSKINSRWRKGCNVKNGKIKGNRRKHGRVFVCIQSCCG